MIDISIALLLLLGIYSGYKKGLLITLLNFITLLISYLISFLLSSRLAFIIVEFIPIKEELLLNNSSLHNLNIAEGYYKVITFFMIFFLIRFALKIIFRTLNIITKLPVIKTANKISGAVFGFLEVYIIIFVFIYLIYVLPLSVELHNSFSSSFLPNIIFEQTPILSRNLLENYFNYK